MAPEAARWAKAPAFTDRPELRSRLAERTEADRRDQLESGLTTARCRRCDACVLVKKNSSKHLSVQWNAGAVRTCEEFARHADGSGSSALVDTCRSLQDSIDEAVEDGRIEVGSGEPSRSRRGGPA